MYLLFLDAAHFILQPFITSLWCIARVFVKAAAGRNRINVLGVINAITKEVTTITNTTYINANTIVEFLTKLKEQYADKPLKIVLDNAAYQHCKLVTDAAKKLQIELLFLPPYSPNLNIIERLWKFTRKKILNAKYYDKPAAFHNAINTFFSQINLKSKKELKSIMTLKFQFFNEEKILFYTA